MLSIRGLLTPQLSNISSIASIHWEYMVGKFGKLTPSLLGNAAITG